MVGVGGLLGLGEIGMAEDRDATTIMRDISVWEKATRIFTYTFFDMKCLVSCLSFFRSRRAGFE